MIAALFVSLGVLGDLTAMNRRLLDEILVNTRMLQLDGRRDHDGRDRP
jgi:hypothetical protein